MRALRSLAADTMRSFGLLTRLRVPARWFLGFDGRYDRAARAFPLVGMAVGALCATIGVASAAIGLPVTISAMLAVGGGIVATGALHEDGLADAADGLGGRDVERRLAIMRDSAIGVYGVIALIGSLAFKVAAVSAVLPSPSAAFAALVAACAVSRTVLVWLWHSTPPARVDGAAASSGRPSAGTVRMAAAIAGAPLLLGAAIVGPWPTILALLAAMLAGFAIRRYAMTLGGHTGDLLGACVVLAEVGMLVALTLGRH